MPSAAQLRAAPSAVAYAAGMATCDALANQLTDPEGEAPTDLTVLSYILMQTDLLSRRLTTEDRGEQLRSPVCLDASESGVKSLVAQLQSTHGSIAAVTEPAQDTRRTVLTVLLKMLQLNVGAMAAAGEVSTHAIPTTI